MAKRVLVFTVDGLLYDLTGKLVAGPFPVRNPEGREDSARKFLSGQDDEIEFRHASPVKLSSAQARELVSMCDQGRYTCINTYAPVNKLIDLGLAESLHVSSFGQMAVKPTEAGRTLRATLGGRL